MNIKIFGSHKIWNIPPQTTLLYAEHPQTLLPDPAIGTSCSNSMICQIEQIFNFFSIYLQRSSYSLNQET